ncbi:MAG TPA: MFS transporter [Pseudonocardia sp.]|uniref:MFS transporter n=1 Tax=Pseudonocardia sp. TaxID=60912 RepID=UPI002CF642F4|nr:MFS transporter [Pseudonocardia sp.]HTF48951.1 MFS transporter [Pseudonocardia sp.]
MARTHGLGEVFRSAEFRALWAAELFSILGDQLARVGLAVLVYGRTGSAAWTAATYALTFLPALAGGVLLGRLADRYRRRELMMVADLARAGLLGVMALPGVPLWLLCVLLVVVVTLGAPHSAAQGALLPDVLGSRFEAGLAVRQITSQTAQLAGFGLGGAALTVVSPSVALAADALTFAASAALVRFGLRDRPVAAGPGATPPAAEEQRAGDTVTELDAGSGAAVTGLAAAASGAAVTGSDAEAGLDAGGLVDEVAGKGDATPERSGSAPSGAVAEWLADTRAGVHAVVGNRTRRVLAGLVWLVGCYVVPEGLAAPYAAELNADPFVVGLLMAADPAGSVVGAWLITRLVPAHLRPSLIGVCAVAGGLSLAGCFAGSGVVGSVLLWGISGLFSSACLVQAQASFVRATPDELRGRAIGVAASGLIAAQGIAILLAGVLAEWIGAVPTVGLTGLAGALVAGVLALRWRRAAVGSRGFGTDGVPMTSES